MGSFKVERTSSLHGGYCYSNYFLWLVLFILSLQGTFSKFISEVMFNGEMISSEYQTIQEAINANSNLPKRIIVSKEEAVSFSEDFFYINSTLIIEGEKNLQKIFFKMGNSRFSVYNSGSLVLKNLDIEFSNEGQGYTHFVLGNNGVLLMDGIEFLNEIRDANILGLGNNLISFLDCKLIDVLDSEGILLLFIDQAASSEIIIENFQITNCSRITLASGKQTLSKIFIKNLTYFNSAHLTLLEDTSFELIIVEIFSINNCLLKSLIGQIFTGGKAKIGISSLYIMESDKFDPDPLFFLYNIEICLFNSLILNKSYLSNNLMDVRGAKSLTLMGLTINQSVYESSVFMNFSDILLLSIEDISCTNSIFDESSFVFMNSIIDGSLENFGFTQNKFIDFLFGQINQISENPSQLLLLKINLTDNLFDGDSIYIFTKGVVIITFENLQFSRNDIYQNGVIFELDSSQCKADMVELNISLNKIYSSCIMISFSGIHLKIVNSEFSQNENLRQVKDGLIYFSGMQFTFQGNIYKNNSLQTTSFFELITGPEVLFNLITIDSCIFRMNKGNNSLINFYQANGLKLVMNRCNFAYNIFDEHGVLYLRIPAIEKDKFEVWIENSIFSSNKAYNGAVGYFSTRLMKITFLSCLFSKNKATISGGVFFLNTESNNFLNFKTCYFIKNKAPTSAVFHLMLGVIIDKSSIFIGNTADIASTGKIESYSLVRFEGSIIKNAFASTSFNIVCFGTSTLVLENVTFDGCSSVESSAGLGYFSKSKILCRNCYFFNISAKKGSILYGAYSYQESEFENCFVLNSMASTASLFILISVKVKIRSLSMVFSKGILLQVTSSTLNIENFVVHQISYVSERLFLLLNIEERTRIRMEGLTIVKVNIGDNNQVNKALIIIKKDSSVELCQGLINPMSDSFSNTIFIIDNSEILIHSCLIVSRSRIGVASSSKLFCNYSYLFYNRTHETNRSTGITLISSQFQIISSSINNFTNSSIIATDCTSDLNLLYKSFIFASTADNGGGVFLINCNITIESTIFSRNSALVNGGALFFDCLGTYKYRWEIQETLFNENKASRGSGIFWTCRSPSIDEMSLAPNIEIPYFISSMPIFLFPDDSNDFQQYKSFISGHHISGKLKFYYKDFYNNTLDHIDHSVCRISIVPSTSKDEYLIEDKYSLIGDSIVYSEKGELVFEGLKLIGIPETVAQLKIEVDHISHLNEAILGSSTLLKQYTSNSIDPLNFKYSYNFLVNFSKCSLGQIYNKELSVCVKCPEGTYSFLEDDISCSICPENAYCPGGSMIDVKSGYWRASTNSTMIFKCKLVEACPGGASANYCEKGYQGPLCDVCYQIDSTPFYRDLDKQCKSCKSFNLAKALILFFLFFILSVIYISNMIRQKLITTNNLMSDLFKLFTDYLQITGFLLTSGLDIPIKIGSFDLVGDFLDFIDPIKIMDSFECSLSSFEPDINIFFKKRILIALLFVILASLVYFVGYLWHHLIKKPKKTSFQKFLTISYIVIFYAYQPSVIKIMFDILKCQAIENKSYLTKYLAEECWSETHMQFIYYLAVPMLLIFMLLIPGFYFFKMSFAIKKGSSLENYYFWSGSYKSWFYFWDLLVMFQKYLIICSLTFIKDTRLMSLINSLIIFTFFLLSQVLKPFKFRPINIASTLKGISTFSTSIFIAIKSIGNMPYAVSLISYIILLLFNLLFLLIFLKTFLLFKKSLAIFIHKFILCCFSKRAYFIDVITGRKVEIDKKEESLIFIGIFSKMKKFISYKTKTSSLYSFRSTSADNKKSSQKKPRVTSFIRKLNVKSWEINLNIRKGSNL